MDPENHQLHVVFFPLMAHGHLIPSMDMAKLFAARGVKTTIITTPGNAPLFAKTVGRNRAGGGAEISIKTIKFPSEEVGLPEGFENLDAATTPDLSRKFFGATSMLQRPLEQFLEESRPHCLVADMFFPWATDAAARFGIPTLLFHGTSFFSLCSMASLRLYEPYKRVSSDSEPFILPNLPDEIKMTRLQIPEHERLNIQNDFTKLLDRAREADQRSYGVVVNSFYELEPAYADHYRKVMGRRAWHIGPVSLCNRGNEEKAERGKTAAIDEHECLKWLNSKKSNSVIYICFGSVAKFPPSQLFEIARALEASGQQFIWVVRKGKDEEEENQNEDWLPEQFEERIEGKGLIIRGWAPQVLILDHEAIGAFVTHCGWNSVLEGVCAGVPMVTWPVYAEQFYNEKLVTQILRIGVAVGAQKWSRVVGDSVKREAIERAVRMVMAGEEAEGMRSRAKALGEMAKRAVEEGGSSHSDLNALIEDLSSRRA
ncbi:scopoletin glucosyltransferase-like [Malania oleifera]|uniref:scopoletin glucosyltransferase-like n=1 Tax=Malania oleifera TaxID=397392 RepID=UPI0025AE8A4B|nr:scopoletin glucosyltransferase-like [Malania oleifera]